MPPIKFGDVVVSAIPYSNLQKTKYRPAIVINSEEFYEFRSDILLLAVTSQEQSPDTKMGRLIISGWKEAGLLKSSWFKPSVSVINHTLLDRKLGKLATDDITSLKELLRKMIIFS